MQKSYEAEQPTFKSCTLILSYIQSVYDMYVWLHYDFCIVLYFKLTSYAGLACQQLVFINGNIILYY